MRGKQVLLLLGKIDDVDETFVNGVKIGGLGALPPNYQTAWDVDRRYVVPAGILRCDGTDLVAIRDYNGEKDAGLYEAPGSIVHTGPFDSDSPSGTAQGYTDGGVGWYRKTFTLPQSDSGRTVTITFDGVYMNSEVWINGQSLGVHPYGYTSFWYDITPYLHFGNERNTMAVRVDSSGRTSRWYSGSGIYRPVWLTVTSPVHIPQWGVSLTTPRVSDQTGTVEADTTVENHSKSKQLVRLTSLVQNPAGTTVASASAIMEIGANEAQVAHQQFSVPTPRLWSPDSPVLYHVSSKVVVAGNTVDEMITPFGIRTLSWSADNGFLLNGKMIKLRGGCVHHDDGILGSRAYDRAEERRVQILKAAGFNAIRTSHNPPSTAFLDACDRVGMLVLDEAFDCWKYGKNSDDYGKHFSDNWESDIDSMVLRDRNHPSVVIWSIGNEIPEQHSPEAAITGGMLADRIRSLDKSRPITEALNPNGTEDWLALLSHLDIVSYNYAPGNYASEHQKYANRMFIGTESFPASAYDAWMPVEDNTFAFGDFVWTAWDYLGEAGIGKSVPQGYPDGIVPDARLWTVSNCGDIDLDGNRRPQNYYRNAVWGVGNNVSAFVEAMGPDGQPQTVQGWGWRDERASWTWPGVDGKPLNVRVYASTPQVKLILNGSDLGTKPTNRQTRYEADYQVPYAPGELDAVGLDDQGREVGRWALKTASPASAIRITPDRSTITANGEDLSYVTVELVDKSGNVDPNASQLVHFRVTGNAVLAAVGNADPRCNESFQQPQRSAYRGRALMIIRSTTDSGDIHITASAIGLKPADVTIRSTR
jgi:beta-galactosidase